MQNMKRQVLAVILSIGILFVAVGTPIALARWTHLKSISLSISRTGSTVTSETTIKGQPGTTKISASYKLEKLVNGNYQSVDTWTASSSSAILYNSRNTTNCTAGTYKLSVTVTITRDGTKETVTDSLVKTI